MIVLDASALVDWLLGTPRVGARIGDRMRDAGEAHTLDFAHLEVMSALRSGIARRELAPERADLALDRLAATPLSHHRPGPFVARAWSLRDTHTPYDAAYVALAEALDAPLVTTDRGLARSRGHRAKIVEAGA
jgi:predicted nucleic acid-binding protein